MPAMTWVVPLFSFTSPPVPLSSRRGGINIAGGHPQTPVRGKSLWTSFNTVIARSPGDEAIPGLVFVWTCKREMLKRVQHDNMGVYAGGIGGVMG